MWALSLKNHRLGTNKDLLSRLDHCWKTIQYLLSVTAGKKQVRPSILYTPGGGRLETLPAVIERRQRYTLDKSPVHCKAMWNTNIDWQRLTLTHKPLNNLDLLDNLTCMILRCRMKGTLGRTHEKGGNSKQQIEVNNNIQTKTTSCVC